VTEVSVDAAGERLAVARGRLKSCRAEIQRLSRMKRRRTVTRCRVNRELRLVVRLLQLRDRIADAFWRTFVLIIGTSVLVAVAFLASRHTPYTATAVGGAGVVAAVALTLVVFFPPDGSLNRRRLVLSQVAASIDYEHQNVCSQLDFLRQRRDTVQSQLKFIQQQIPPPVLDGGDTVQVDVGPPASGADDSIPSPEQEATS
jgi:hypothetical protein